MRCLQHLDPTTVAGLVRVAADALLQIWPDIEHDPQLAQILRVNTATLTWHDRDALWQPYGHPVLFRAGRASARMDFSTVPSITGQSRSTTRHVSLAPTTRWPLV